MTLRAESLPRPGSDEYRDLQIDWPMLAHMVLTGRPITREMHITLNWPEPPEQWTEEHEEKLPSFLQQ